MFCVPPYNEEYFSLSNLQENSFLNLQKNAIFTLGIREYFPAGIFGRTGP